MSNSLPGFRSGLPATKVDQSLRRALAALDVAHQCALLWFHDTWQRKLYRDLGFASMEQYATEALKFSPNRTWQFLRLARDLDRLPPLLEAVTDGSLAWTKAQQVGRVATPETAADWVTAAKQTSRRQLARKIKAARAGKQKACAGQGELPLATPAETEPPPPRVTMGLSFDSLDAARLDAMIEAARKSGAIAAEATREDAVLAALASLVGAGDSRFLRRHKSSPPYRVVLYRCRDCQRTEVVTGAGRKPVGEAAAAAVIENAVIHDAGRNRSAVRPATRQKVLARDGHRCRAPGCRAVRFLEVHHLEPRQHGGSHQPENLVTLCSRCHRYLHTRGGQAAWFGELVDGPGDSTLNESDIGATP